MRIVVGIASVGRADVLRRVVDRLADQTRLPDDVILSVVGAEDVFGVHDGRINPTVLLSPKGLCAQRNQILDMVADTTDLLVFFDDDFVPANDYFEKIEELFSADKGLVGATGQLIADGIHGDPVDFDCAVKMLDAAGPAGPQLRDRQALYGCNMAIRMNAASALRFDEHLPLYGWQEDIDFTFQLGQRGRMVSGPSLTGVHLGSRRARQPGFKLGYSQVANVVYLARKGTMQPGLGRRLLVQNVASNAIRSLWQEPGIDRRGRLRGNLLAITDWMRGKIDPQRILEL